MFGMFVGRPDMTLQSRMALARGYTRGFDYIRVVLALGVVVWHTVVTCYGDDYQVAVWKGWARPPVAMILPMFFALSGFLVAGSLERCKTLAGFLSLRALRLIPALAAEVLLSALIVGPLITDLPLSLYFGSPEFPRYFLNILGDIQYRLPGVFSSNPLPFIVNGQLWTIPYELKCYLLISLYALAGIHRSKWLFAIVVVVMQVAFGLQALLTGGSADAANTVPGGTLVLCFLSGIAFYLHRERVIHSHTLGVASLAVTVILLLLPGGDSFVAFTATYFTVYLGLFNPSRLAFMKTGDYSYGIFLYGFPVQQAIAHLGAWTHHWAVSLALSIPVVACVAAFSWHGIEKHALKLRRYLYILEESAISNAFTRFSRFKSTPIQGK